MENTYDSTKKCGNELSAIVRKFIELRDSKNADNLPVLPSSLSAIVDRISKEEFTLVVSGEVNRGKSTFINAIIGKDILPTYDKETTSQVFKIRNSSIESFCVVYDNGDRQIISKEELEKYGTESDNSLICSNNKRILYIEVCTCIKNLPEGVVIVDTPGIGSTYKQHTEIARNFMQEADAIIYLCSSKHPLVKVDIDFIKDSVLPIKTLPNVLFVMSKADLVNSEQALENLIDRAENQLIENFKDNTSIIKKVIPVDSLSLRDSNIADGEAKSILRKASNYEAIYDSIKSLIGRQRFFWIVGLYNLIVRYYKLVSQYITKQIGDYDLSIENRKEKIDSVNHRLQILEKDLGLDKQRATLTKITQIMHGFKHDLELIYTSSRSSLLSKYLQKVDDISDKISPEDLQYEAQSLFKDVIDECASKWDEMCGTAINAIQNELNVYSKDCQLQVDEEYNLPPVDNDKFELDVDIKMSDRLEGMRNKYFMGSFVTIIGWTAINTLAATSTTVATLLSTAISTGPIGWIVGGGGLAVYGLIYGNRKAKEKKILSAKSDIKVRIKEILAESYSSLTRTSLMDGKYESLVNSFEKHIEESSTETIGLIYSNAKAELENLKKSLLESQDSSNRTKLVNQQTLWNTQAERLRLLAPSIKQINDIIV